MEIIFRTVDGKEFFSEMEARKHENSILEGIVMIGRDCQPVQRTEDAFVLWLRDEAANLAFFALAKRQGDNGIAGLVEGEDYGLFYWDEDESFYRYIDNEILTALVKAQSVVREKTGFRFC